MAKRASLKITSTSTFTIPAPTNDELTELAMDAGIEGDEPTDTELDEAYKNWKTRTIDRYEEGEDIPYGAHNDIEAEEVL